MKEIQLSSIPHGLAGCVFLDAHFWKRSYHEFHFMCNFYACVYAGET
jgi:hypothetical protein